MKRLDVMQALKLFPLTSCSGMECTIRVLSHKAPPYAWIDTGCQGEFLASRLKKTTLVNCMSHPPTVNLFCLMLGTGGRDMQSAQTRWCICSQYFLGSNSTITISRNLHAHSQGNFDICIAVWVFALHLVDLTHMIPIRSLHVTVHVCFH